jgi:very-short-patch-repair endonuclease
VPQPARVPPELRRKVFRGSTAVAAGLLTKNQLHGPVWRRLFPDVYVHRDAPDDHLFRARAAAGVFLPGAVVTGVSAAALWGVDLTAEEDDVELTVPPHRHPVRVPGLRVRRAPLPDEDVVRRLGVAVTCPPASAARIAAALPLDEAVIAVDRLVAAGLVELDPVRAHVAAMRGAGCARARRVVELADGLAESPQETRLRLLLRRSGLPAPVAQFVVRDEQGRLLARVDFAWPELRVALEYDGLWHAEAGQFRRDRQRLNRLHAAGWLVLFVTAADLHRPDEILARLWQLVGRPLCAESAFTTRRRATERTPPTGYSQPLRLKPR